MSASDIETGAGLHRAYADQARSWAQDRQAALDRSKRAAWLVAAIAAGIGALEALALIALAPLKTVVPFTLLVDRNTGFVEALDPVHPPALKPQAALTQSLLAQYVVARESFDLAGLPQQYQQVALWSAKAARRDYLAAMARDNPDGPLGRYTRDTVVEAHVESVAMLGPDTALVRFYTDHRDPDRGARPREYWAALLRFHFAGEPTALADRLVNPLGFQVVQYRRAQEAPPPQPLPAASLPQSAVPPAAIRPACPQPAGQVAPPGVTQTL